MKKTEMNVQQSSSFLTRIYLEFKSYMATHKVDAVPVNDLAIMLSNYWPQYRPSLLADILLKSTNSKKQLNKNSLYWDQLLQFMYIHVSLTDQVQKIQRTPANILEIQFARFLTEDDDQFQFLGDIIKHIKAKQSNIVKQIFKHNILTEQLLVVRFDKQILLYSLVQKRILNILTYKYINMEEKMLEKNQHKKQMQSVIYIEKNDTVQPISKITKRSKQDDSLSRKNSEASSELRSVVHKSGSGSALSHQHPMKRNFTRTISRTVTEGGSGDMFLLKNRFKQKKKVQQFVKIRNNDPGKVFKLFQQTNLQGSISIAKSFIQSRQSFQNHMTLHRNVLEKQVGENVSDPTQVENKKDYRLQIKKMRTLSKKLNQTSQRQSYKNNISMDDDQVHKNLSKHKLQVHLRKNKKKSCFDHIQQNIIQIQSISFDGQFMLASFQSRDVRLYCLKKSLHNFREDLIFQKNFSQLALYVLLYKSQIRELHNIALGFAQQRTMRIVVYQLNRSMNIDNQVFKAYISFVPICKPFLPLGFAGYNQEGIISIVELNSSVGTKNELKSLDKQFCNFITNEKISISCIEMFGNMIDIYIGDKSGYIHIIDRLTKNVRLSKQVSHRKIVDFTKIKTQHDTTKFGSYLLVWLQNSEAKIINTLNLECMFSVLAPTSSVLFQNFKAKNSRHIAKIGLNQYILYDNRSIISLNIVQNLNKQFERQIPSKIFHSRQKIINKHIKNKKQVANKQQMIKTTKQNVIQQLIIQNDILILVGSQYEIAIYQFIKNAKVPQYIGSYYSLSLANMIMVKIDQTNKYLAIVFQGNKIQVINIFTQTIYLSMSTKISEEIIQFFVTNNMNYFLGIFNKDRILTVHNNTLDHKKESSIDFKEFYATAKQTNSKQSLSRISRFSSISKKIQTGLQMSYQLVKENADKQIYIKLIKDTQIISWKNPCKKILIHLPRIFTRSQSFQFDHLLDQASYAECQLYEQDFKLSPNKDKILVLYKQIKKIICVNIDMKLVSVFWDAKKCPLFLQPSIKIHDYSINGHIFLSDVLSSKYSILKIQKQQIIEFNIKNSRTKQDQKLRNDEKFEQLYKIPDNETVLIYSYLIEQEDNELKKKNSKIKIFSYESKQIQQISLE